MSGHVEAGITHVPCGGGVFGGPMTQKRNPVRNGRCLTAYKATGAAVAIKLALAPIRLNTRGPDERLSATQGSAEVRLDLRDFLLPNPKGRDYRPPRHATSRRFVSGGAMPRNDLP